jgi:beta propeller repeat protein
MKRAELYCVIIGIVSLVSTTSAVQVYPFPICTDPTGQEWARVSGNTVVWIESRNGNRDVYGYNIQTKTEFPICAATTDEAYPMGLDISGNSVVYHRINRGWKDVYGYTLPAGPEFPIRMHDGDSKDRCRIDGGLVVYMSYRSVMGAQLGGAEFLICGRNCDNPAVSGNIVVWEEKQSGKYYSDIFGKNIQSGEEFVVCNYFSGKESTSNKTNPAVSGNIVVWQDSRGSGGSTDIYGKNLITGEEFPICTHSGFQLKPDISGNIVVWVDNRVDGVGQGVYGKNLLTGEEFVVALSTTVGTVAIDGNIVVWDSSLDIYGAYLTDPDLNRDGRIALDDLGIMSSKWGQSGCASPDYCGGADLNLNGSVEVEDLSILAHFWLFGTAEGGE